MALTMRPTGLASIGRVRLSSPPRIGGRFMGRRLSDQLVHRAVRPLHPTAPDPIGPVPLLDR